MNTIIYGYREQQSVTGSISELCNTLCLSAKQCVNFFIIYFVVVVSLKRLFLYLYLRIQNR